MLRVAKNRALDILRRQGRWEEKRAQLERLILPDPVPEAAPQVFFSGEVEDDELRMVFATCHPALPRDQRVALTLRALGGFGVGEIARAFLTAEPTIAQRLVRAKRKLRESDIRLIVPPAADLPERLDSVLEVLYLMFNEGHTTARGESLVRIELCSEAIRLVELLASNPAIDEARVDALAALFFFQAARLPARTGERGELIPLALQDRSRWDRRLIRRALTYHRRSARGDTVSSYHLQAEIASFHTLAPSYEGTDWSTILARYDELLRIDPSPVVALNRVVAVAEVEGPLAALEALQPLKEAGSLDSYYPLFATEAELLERLGRRGEAERAISAAVELVGSEPVRLHLQRRRVHPSRRTP